jgi:hypothetical protein
MTRKCLLIAGPHRGGTSAVAGALYHAGVYFGPKARLMPPSPANPRGYFENLDVVRAHDLLLGSLGRTWRSTELPEDWLDTAAAKAAYLKLRAIVIAQLARRPRGTELFAVKDPRLCLLLPIWHEVLFGIADMLVLLVLRDARACARSLSRRDGIDLETGEDMAVQHMNIAVRDGPKASRCMPIATNRLLDDPTFTLAQVASVFDIEDHVNPSAPEIRGFLEPEMFHG